jgi:D-alanyl-D-alanine carboxypeptidase
MKSKLMLIVAFSILTSCSLTPRLQEEDLPGQELQETLDSYREAGGMIGVSAAIISEEGELWTGVSGNSYPRHPITPDMVFDMGSSGKNLAAALMLDLAEDGLVNLDDPIEAYIDPPPGVDGSIPIRLLLNHTSGLANVVEHPDSPFRKPYHLIDFERGWEIDEIFTDLGADPYFPPGEGWHYSQAGYEIATLIVEEVTGMTMAESVQSRLLDPLGIHGMVLDMSQPLPDGVEMAHNWVDIKGYGIPQDMADKSRNWIASISRITYYTTAGDFARWGQALFSGQVLEPGSLDQMLDFVRITDYGNEPPIFSGYGLGVVEWVPEMLNGHYGYGHSGSIPGYRAFMAYLPESGLTIVVLSNTNKEEELGALINALLEVAVGEDSEQKSSAPLFLYPADSLPEDGKAVQVFSNEKLFCDHLTRWEASARSDQWIDLGQAWVVATTAEKAQQVWQYHDHRISVSGLNVENLDQYQQEVEHYQVTCPDGTLDLYARGFKIYLPPLPSGEYEIVWRSVITDKFHNGFAEYRVGDFLEARAQLTVLDSATSGGE